MKAIKLIQQNMIIVCFTVLCSCSGEFGKVAAVLSDGIVEQSKTDIHEPPQTVTDYVATRSAGGIHDFYSEGDYWWPNPENPNGPYIRRDGETNPENFVAHRHAMIRFSKIVGNFTSLYLLTGSEEYAKEVERHAMAWFVNPQTLMNPSLLYAQAIKGVVTGRGIGIIDTLHLVEVAQSLLRLREAGVLSDECYEGTCKWFSEYLTWMNTHPYGVSEMNTKNNHATCWAVQAASFAKYVGNKEVMDSCKDMFKNRFMVSQMAADGSFPQELQRTKPFGYSLFNLDAMAALCQILSTPDDDLWNYTTPDGKNMRKALDWILPYIVDKTTWPYDKDVMYWDEWPVAQPAMIFGWLAFHDDRYLNAWLPFSHFPTNEEVVRNLPLRNPLIWMDR